MTLFPLFLEYFVKFCILETVNKHCFKRAILLFQMDEMENLRIEGELEKQKMMRVRGAENRDSGVADMEIIPQTSKDGKLSPESAASANNLKRSALSNSLLDLHEQRKDCLLPGPARVYGAFFH